MTHDEPWRADDEPKKPTSGACPHCGARLLRWRVPEEAAWGQEYFLVCFNDDCAYYVRGWTWMQEQYNQRVSYRYALNPGSGADVMIPVWSPTALRDLIIEDEPGGGP